MKGLLLKDVYMLEKNFKSYVLVILVISAVSLVGDDNLFLVTYPPVLLSLLPMSLLGYDEKDGWEKYSLTMPYKRSELVSSKYIMGLILSFGGIVIVISSQLIKMHITGANNISGIITIGFLAISLCFLLATISYPMIFKFGVEKGRIGYSIIIVLIVMVGVVIGMMLTDELKSEEITFLPGVLVVFMITAVLYVLSWLLSIRVFSKRDI